ncbi:hypothetical protein EDD22DRAFT_1007221 [Suillus occidentalis]|nr:hypothetical protein EDD22DRAFT_1007221 [Suillus occidentalis]
MWALLWDMCSKQKCQYFAVTTYGYWALGNFNHDMETAYISNLFRAPVFAHDAQVEPDWLPCPGLPEILLFWMAACLMMPSDSKLFKWVEGSEDQDRRADKLLSVHIAPRRVPRAGDSKRAWQTKLGQKNNARRHQAVSWERKLLKDVAAQQGSVCDPDHPKSFRHVQALDDAREQEKLQSLEWSITSLSYPNGL